MTISSSTSRRLIFVATLAVALASPAIAAASVKITNAMYDPPGADTGHEWIEIQNQDSSPVDLSGYRLFEGGTNHKLTAAVGTSSLAVGAEAIITTDPAQYATDHPEFSGTVFKSTFSLSNTAETISLKDAKLAVVDTYSYTAPPVVKAAPAPKTKPVKKSTATTGKSSYSYTKAATAGAEQAASPALANLPQIPEVWLYSAALAALVMFGIGGFVYVKLSLPAFPAAETSPSSEEFELE